MLKFLKRKIINLCLCIKAEKLLEKYETIWTKTEDLKNIEWNALPVYNDRYIKLKNELMKIKFIQIFVA